MAAPGSGTPHSYESEDLFDFPVIEIKLEASAETPPPVPVAASGLAAGAPTAAGLLGQAGETSAHAPDDFHATAEGAAGPANVRGATEDENEDLFDFPLVEIAPEEPAAVAPAARAAATPSLPSVATPAQTAPATAARPAPAPAPAASAPHAVAEKSTNIAAAAQAPRSPAPAKDATPPDEQAKTPGRKRLRLAGARPLWIALAVIALGNLTGLWYLWQSHSSVGAGIEDLREQLDMTARRIERERRQAASKERLEAAAALDPATAAIGSIERASVEIALQQLNSGEYAAARVRLQKLLAQADRMERSVRDELEPRIVYLVAQSYYDEARVRRGAAQ